MHIVYKIAFKFLSVKSLEILSVVGENSYSSTFIIPRKLLYDLTVVQRMELKYPLFLYHSLTDITNVASCNVFIYIYK